ncbi:unnamed protein product [Onchocerca flexuosa]|uniref:Structural protein n=1 Tax=Onchocerca flexuosa TaxID=387005 RepID=A0A183GZU5_9BILA|nr:unnamed protein product [Onchocerca flexuosa]
MALIKIERGSVAEQLQQFGDIITKNDDKKIKSQKQCEELLTKIDKNDYNVFVTCIVEHILAGMSLTVGDAKILNVDSVPVTTITLINKQPNYTLAAAYVRYTLMVEKSVEMDLSFAPAVIDIYKQECKRMKRNPDLKSNQNILKYQDDKPRLIDSRIQITEKTEDISIAREDNPALPTKVSIKYTIDQQ